MLLDDLNERLGRVLLGMHLQQGRTFDVSDDEDEEGVEPQNTFLRHFCASYRGLEGYRWWPYCFFSNTGFRRRVSWEVVFAKKHGVMFNVAEGAESTRPFFDTINPVSDAQSDESGSDGERGGWEDGGRGQMFDPAPDAAVKIVKMQTSEKGGGDGGFWKSSKRHNGRVRRLRNTRLELESDVIRTAHERSQLFINLYVILYHWAKYDSGALASDALVVSGPPSTDTADPELQINGMLIHPRLFSMVECFKTWAAEFPVGFESDSRWTSANSPFPMGSLKHCMFCDLEDVYNNMFSKNGPVFAALVGGEPKRLDTDTYVQERYEKFNTRARVIVRDAVQGAFGSHNISKPSMRKTLVDAICAAPAVAGPKRRTGKVTVDGVKGVLTVREQRGERLLLPMFDGADDDPTLEYPRRCMFVVRGATIKCSDGTRELEIVPGLSSMHKVK